MVNMWGWEQRNKSGKDSSLRNGEREPHRQGKEAIQKVPT